MKIVLISGSRSPDGQTGRAAKSFMEGCVAAGGEVESFLLPRMKIERCRQCEDSGWGLCIKEGRCTVDDDLASLVERVRASDAVVFATPVYWGDLAESLRAFLDRLRRVCMHEAGRTGVAKKPAAGICVAGGSGGGAPSCAASLAKVLGTIGFDVVDLVPVRRQNLESKLKVLRAAGEHLAGLSLA